MTEFHEITESMIEKNLSIDSFLKRGKSHPICQDYILTHPELNAVILSDGCSTSPMTDVGARILSVSALSYLHEFKNEIRLKNPDYDKMGSWIINRAVTAVKILGISKQCLDATLIIAYRIDHEVYVYMYGDGEIIFVSDNGRVTTYEIYVEPNLPYYLSYELDYHRRMGHHKSKVTKFVRETTPEYSVVDDYTSASSHTYFKFSLFEYPVVLISSDGLSSFEHLTKSLYETIKDLLIFKTTNPKARFLFRRTRKVIKKLEDDGAVHTDDISIGGFRLGKDELCDTKSEEREE